MKYICLFLLLVVSCKKKTDIKIPESESLESGAEEDSADSSVDEEAEQQEEEEGSEEPSEEETENSETPDQTETPQKPGSTLKDPKTAVMALDDLSLELPCKDYLSTKFDCTTTADFERSVVVGGDSSTVYEVVIRVRGVTEPMTYSGGVLEGKHFYTGGTSTNLNFNIYSITTENPKEVYYPNYQPAVGGYVLKVDYTAKIKVKGASTVKIFASAQNGTIISNNQALTVPEITKSPDVVQGQYLQINVVSASAL